MRRVDVYVCVCEAINEKRVQEAIERGARTLRDVGQACGAGTSCGTCAKELKRRLERAGSGAAK